MQGRDVRSKSLSVVHGDVVAVHPTDLDIAAGEIFAILGPAAAGKSSLLRAVAGHLAPALGRILIGGADVTDLAPERRPTVAVLTDPALLPHLSVADNAAFGLEARGIPRAVRRARTRDLLAIFGLAERGDHRPDGLADADRRRVALARAAAVEPAVLLLDEPFTGLDLSDRRRLRTELKALQRRTGATIVLTATDPGDVLALADRVAVMVAGHIDQTDTPDRLYDRPATAAVARCLGENNLLPGRVVEIRGARVAVDTAVGRLWATTALPLAPGTAVELAVRPERLLLDGERALRGLAEIDASGWNRLVGELVGRTLDGPTLTYDFAVADTRLRLLRPNLGSRDRLLPSLHAIGFHADDVLVFPADERGGGDDG